MLTTVVNRARHVNRTPAATVSAAITACADAVRCVAFWLAVILPFLALACLIAGVHTVAYAMLAVNAVCLLVGHGHNPR